MKVVYKVRVVQILQIVRRGNRIFIVLFTPRQLQLICIIIDHTALWYEMSLK